MADYQNFQNYIANINFASMSKRCILKTDIINFKYTLSCWKKSSKESTIWSVIT